MTTMTVKAIDPIEVRTLTDAELTTTLDQLDRSMRVAQAEYRWRRQQQVEATQRERMVGGRRGP